MLGYLMGYPTAEINHWPNSGFQGGDWHLALHNNDVKDTIAYDAFLTRDAAIRAALGKGIKRKDIYFSEGANHHVKDADVKFTCCHCGHEFVMGGGAIHYSRHIVPVCGQCLQTFIKSDKNGGCYG